MVQIPEGGLLVGKDALRAGIQEILGPDFHLAVHLKSMCVAGTGTERKGVCAVTQNAAPEWIVEWTLDHGDRYTAQYRRLTDGSWVVERQIVKSSGHIILPDRINKPGLMDIYSPGHFPG
jgi:hypothetical protein